MSNSYGAEQKLRELADDLQEKAAYLERAADVLRILRDSGGMEKEIKDAKEWAESWLKS